MMQVKSLKHKAQTSTITLEHGGIRPELDEITAMYVLVGGYNSHGRSIPIEVYEDIKARHDALIDEVKALLA